MPPDEVMGPSRQYLYQVRQQMALLDELPEWQARAIHEFGWNRGLTVRTEAELNRLLTEGKRPNMPST